MTKAIFALVALAILCVSVSAQENTASYWLNRGDEIMNELLADSYHIYHINDTSPQPDRENISIWLGKNDESIKAYKMVLEITNETVKRNPQDAETWRNRGAALASLGLEDAANESYGKAIEIYNQSISENSMNTSALLSKAGALEILGRSEAALEAYDKIIALNSTNIPYALIRTSDIFYRLSKYNESAEAFDRIAGLLANDTGKMAAKAGLKPTDNQFATISGGNLVKKIAYSMRDNHTDTNKVIWKENGSITSINVWIYKGQILRTSFNRYNESNKSYDLYMQADSNFVDYWRSKEISIKSRLDGCRNVLNTYEHAMELLNKTIEAKPQEASV